MTHSTALRITFVLSLLIASSVHVFAKEQLKFQEGTVVSVNDVCDDFCQLQTQYTGTDSPLLAEQYAYDVGIEVGGQLYVLREYSQYKDRPKILEHRRELIAISGKLGYTEDALGNLNRFPIVSSHPAVL